MNETILINATMRDQLGKGAARKLRASGLIPAVVYGHNFKPVSLSLVSSDMNKLFKPGSEATEEYRLYKLQMNHDGAGKETMVIIKEIQRHPVNETIRHIDFFAVRMDEKIIAPVHIRIKGKAAGVKLGGILRHLLREVDVKSLPMDIPPHFDIDVSELQIGDSVHVKDIPVTDKINIITDPEAAIISVVAPSVQKEDKPEGEAAVEQAVTDTAPKDSKETK